MEERRKMKENKGGQKRKEKEGGRKKVKSKNKK